MELLLMDETQKAELTKVVQELLAAKDRPNKFIELIFCRRFLSVVAVIAVVVAKHYGFPITEEELLTVGGTIGALVLGHSYRKPNN